MLSGRLQALASLADDQASSIWDIGCDHGLLGTSFIHSDIVTQIHLVDPSLKVIESLHSRYKDSYITSGKFIKILHQHGQECVLDTERKNVFIAGMGGKEIESIISHLEPQFHSHDRLIISPHRRINELRQTLSKGPWSLIQELLIKDEGQFYQILALSSGTGLTKVHPFGVTIFQGSLGEEYRQQQLKTFSNHQDPLSQDYVAYLKSLLN